MSETAVNLGPLARYAGEAPTLVAASLPEGADAIVVVRALQRLIRDGRGGRAVFIARDAARASAFRNACRFFAPDLPVLDLPAWDCLPYDRVSPSRAVAARRAGALHALATLPADAPLIVVSTVSAVMQKVPPRDALRTSGFAAAVGEDVDRAALEAYLVKNGYARASTVVEPGDYAVRGGIVDCFPPGEPQPLRLDFFGDELESVRAFDVETQLSDARRERVALAPVSEVFLTEDGIGTFRRNYVAAFGGGVSRDPVYASVSDGIRMQGIEHYLPLFYGGQGGELETVFDYLGPGALYALDGLFDEARAERWDLIEDFYDSRRAAVEARDTGSGDPAKSQGLVRPLPPERLYLDADALAGEFASLTVRRHTPFVPGEGREILDFGATAGRSFSAERKTEGANVFEAVVAHVEALREQGRAVLLASWTDGSSERLGSVLADHGLDVSRLRDTGRSLELSGGTVARVVLPVEAGFNFGDLSVVSEQDVLGDRLVNRQRKRRAKNFIAEASALQPGDLVVHIDHGLGRFLGLVTLDIGDAPHDCLELEYAGGAKLYLPVENIELLSRYGAAPETVQLDKLGGVAWQSRKAKAKARLRDMADGLIKIAAKRALRTAEPIDPPAGAYDEFCARFPFAETDDQLSAIADVVTDLESGRPMDRLICGDVGFGKTEVALRAAFLVAMSGKQVAVVAPTTILARQHFKVFSERFRGWPVNVRQLSRLASAKEARETREQLASGRCEIVVGTHAVLAKAVRFSGLGLVVIDEEQRFGVKHKERLKSLRASVHVLTLTATPIPRTLQMALSGIRDLSIIATPPVDRLAVRTYVSPFDEVSIRKAILREKYRGGQSFFIAPRIADLPRLEEFMREEVPEVRTITAHGQMPGTELEDIFTAFYDGQYDVLLSTSIIESGIDIPTANTMVIYRADRFGLAQLYQMRGRVGRSKVRAYAYLTVPDEHVATKGALQRLKVLQSLDTLGAGFTLASHDLDMRGGGNPLGEEQSGHIKDLGVELYQHMLEEAVASLRDEDDVRDESWTPQVNAGVAILIPDTYIPDLNVRLATYRRIADVETDMAADALAAELIDRFGALPGEVESLLKVMQIKRLCRDAHVEKVDAGPKGVVLTMRHQDVSDPQAVLGAIQRHSGWKLRPDQTIFVRGKFDEPKHRLTGALRAVRALVPEGGKVAA